MKRYCVVLLLILVHGFMGTEAYFGQDTMLKLRKFGSKMSTSMLHFAEKSKHEVYALSETFFGGACPIVEDPVASLRHVLSNKVLAQNPAIEAIIHGFSSWQLSRSSEMSTQPMVLAFTGPTGVGKTQTAQAIGDAIFKLKDDTVGKQRLPRGLLMLTGADYGDKSQAARYREDIRDLIMNHFDSCSGNAVIVFDEIQKIAPGVLDSVVSVMDTGVITKVENGVARTVRAPHAVFILISDVGGDEMIQALKDHHSNAMMARESIPQKYIKNVVYEALEKQWERLQFGKMIDRVIPFLPLTHHNIASVVRLKLIELGQALSGQVWNTFEFTPDVPVYMAGNEFITYYVEIMDEKDPNSLNFFAKFGARNVIRNGPISLLKEIIAEEIQNHKIFDVIPVSDRIIKLENCAVSASTSTEDSCVGSSCPVDMCSEGPLKISFCRVSKKYECVVLWRGALGS